MKYDLKGKNVAILATDGFEPSELLEPKKALEEAGATAHVVSPKKAGDTIRGFDHEGWSDPVTVDASLAEADVDTYDALHLPGGVLNPDALRLELDAVDFVKKFFAQHKPVAAICHGPWMVIEAGAANGRRMTSYPSIRTDVQNAGATWVDEEVVVDQGLVTSRSPKDLSAFNAKLLEEIHEGKHVAQTL